MLIAEIMSKEDGLSIGRANCHSTSQVALNFAVHPSYCLSSSSPFAVACFVQLDKPGCLRNSPLRSTTWGLPRPRSFSQSKALPTYSFRKGNMHVWNYQSLTIRSYTFLALSSWEWTVGKASTHTTGLDGEICFRGFQ